MPASVEAKLSRLSLDLRTQTPNASGSTLVTKPEKTPASWDDDTEVEAPGPSLKQITSNDSPGPPPPTPISPQDGDAIARKWDAGLNSDSGKPSPRLTAHDGRSSERRPEKTTATANRMIAGALGLKAPKKTEEQRQYEKAVKEAENKRKNREKEHKEMERLADEEAKAAVWTD